MSEVYKSMNELINKLRSVDTVWKDVYLDGKLSKYKVSNYGDIISYHKKRPKLLKPHVTSNGYQIVCLYSNDGIEHWILVHRLVAMYFIPIPENLKIEGYTFDDLEVNHKNGTKEGKLQNTVYNLEWVTSSENKYHAYRTGLRLDCDKHPESIYTNEQIHHVCKLLEENRLGVREISKQTGVDYPTIAQILSKNQWKPISEKYDFSNRKKQRHLYPKEVIDHVKKLLSEQDKNGLSFSEIGKICGMSRTSVWYIHHKYFKQDMSSTTRES